MCSLHARYTAQSDAGLFSQIPKSPGRMRFFWAGNLDNFGHNMFALFHAGPVNSVCVGRLDTSKKPSQSRRLRTYYLTGLTSHRIHHTSTTDRRQTDQELQVAGDNGEYIWLCPEKAVWVLLSSSQNRYRHFISLASASYLEGKVRASRTPKSRNHGCGSSATM